MAPTSNRIKTRPAAVLTTVAIAAIRTYQAMLRPLLIGSCKFCPSCSEYAIEALNTHGLLRGSLLAAKRLLRCHPFTPGGIDPVPPAKSSPTSHNSPRRPETDGPVPASGD